MELCFLINWLCDLCGAPKMEARVSLAKRNGGGPVLASITLDCPNPNCPAVLSVWSSEEAVIAVIEGMAAKLLPEAAA